jgi:uracil-DNA glycosylase
MRDVWYGTAGSRTPRVVFVGEAWGREEETTGQPFVGQSGKELFRMLGESKVFGHHDLFLAALGATTFTEWVRLRNEWLEANEILFTNTVADRPEGNELWHLFEPNQKGVIVDKVRGLKPNAHVRSELVRLRAQLDAMKPSLVVACGNYALWALTECCSTSNIPRGDGATVTVPGGIMSWRGSMLETTTSTSSPIRVLPLIHPAAILREWYLRTPTLHDIRTRIPMALAGDWSRPAPTFWAPPTFIQARHKLEEWLRRANAGESVELVCDIETRRQSITCVGWSDSVAFGMAIPLVRLMPDRSFESYWTKEEEFALVQRQRALLVHPQVRIIGQNFIYDMQYFLQQFGIRPKLWWDTMIAQHLLFPGTPKGLDYLSSLYCRYHRYWKDDGKEWDAKGTLEQHLLYNCEDLVRTFEVCHEQQGALRASGLEHLWSERLELNELALDMMEESILIDKTRRANLAMELAETASQYELWFSRIIPDTEVKDTIQLKSKKAVPWWRSSTQQRMYFSWLGLRLPKHRKTGNDTFGKEALGILKERHPEYTRLFTALGEFRSVGVFHNTFIKAPLEPNGRMKCSFNVTGTESFRWSSSENAFGRGTNLQNIPAGDEE